MAGPLEGLRVLDLSRLLPGPFCTMLMADMGADVVKVESPGEGDYIRWWPPRIGKNSGFHVVINRNKRSLTLNLKSERGREIFKGLVRRADVVVESFRPGVMDRLGVGYGVLREENPRLIYCSITGYGQDGAKSRRAGHDINFLALSGVLSYCGRRGEPVIPGVQMGDIGGGSLLAAFSVMAALYWRERTGRGQRVDVAMTDGVMTWNCLRWGKFLADGRVPRPGDDMLNHGLACYNLYETLDGRFMSLGALEPKFWKAFCEAVERPEWNRDDYFEPGSHQQDLMDEVACLFRSRTQKEWIRFFELVDCCCEPVRDLDEVIQDVELEARGMVVQMVHQMWGAYRQLGIAPRFSETPGSITCHAPELGEHTAEVLLDAGYSPEMVAEWKARGII